MSRRLELALFWISLVVVLCACEYLNGRYFPTRLGTLGNDYAYFLPRLLAGDYWAAKNGVFAMPWFSPAFGAGLPFYAHPGSIFVSLPQWLSFVVDPLSAVHLTALVFAGLGFAGTWLLVRRTFGTGAWPALFGAVAFALNAFFWSRLRIGHLSFHSTMLVPLIAHCILKPLPLERLRTSACQAAVFAGIGFAYLFQSGNFYGIPPALIAITALWAMQGLSGAARASSLVRIAGAAVVALILCAAKLESALAYLAHCPRTGYPLPGAKSVIAALELVLTSLFSDPPVERAHELVTNTRYVLERHEWEFGVSPMPGLILALGLIAGLWSLRARARDRVRFGWLALLLVALALPVLVNTYGEGWHELLKRVPIVQSSSNLLRWFVAYVPLAVVGAALVLDRVKGRRTLVIATLALVAGVFAWHTTRERGYYVRQLYSPDTIVLAWHELHEHGTLPTVRAIRVPRPGADEVGTLQRDDELASGGSELLCYEPMFGYRLEWFPIGDTRPGDPFAIVQGAFAFKHPAAFLYPDRLQRAAGDGFRLDERAGLEAFLRYEPLAFDWPVLHRIGCALNALALAALGLFLGWTGWTSVRSARN